MIHDWRRTGTRVISGLALVLFLSVAGTAQEEGESSADSKPVVVQEVKDRLAALLPDAGKMGAERDGEIEFYGQNLYELINGAAGIFHDYDFAALGHAIYKKGDSDITVDIYFMGEPLNAFGVFSAESSPDYHFIEIGALGYLEEGIMNFLQGPYYVKLSAYGSEEEQVKTMMKDFAADVSARIGEEKALPEILSILPAKDIVPYSQGFSKKAPLGYQFLAPALTAEYAFGDNRTTLVLSMAADEKEALSRLSQMREQVAKSGSVSDLDDYGSQAFRGKDKYRGDIIGFVEADRNEKHYAVFVVKPPEDAEKFMKEIRLALRPEEK